MLHVRVRKPWAARQLCSGKFELNTTLGNVTQRRATHILIDDDDDEICVCVGRPTLGRFTRLTVCR